MRLATPLVGWIATPGCQYEVVKESGKTILRLHRASPSEKLPSVQVWFGPIKKIAAIHIRCAARWKDVKTGPQGYTFARFVTLMKDADGSVHHPPDFGITGGDGSRDWHHCETVFKFTADMADSGLEISMLGDHGLMEIRDLSITGVRNRSWVPAATVAVLGGWVLLVLLLIRCHPDAPPMWRALGTGAAIVGLSWVFVFPQNSGLLHPVVKNFSVAGLDVAAAPQTPAAPKPPASIETTAPIFASPEVPVVQPETSAATKSPAAIPEPEARGSSALHKALRLVDKRLPIAHFGLFIGITLLVLFLTGRGNQWRIPLALAVLSELVPELADHLGGWDDWADLFQNFAGVGLAVLLWKHLPALRRLSAFPDRAQAHPLDPA